MFITQYYCVVLKQIQGRQRICSSLFINEQVFIRIFIKRAIKNHVTFCFSVTIYFVIAHLFCTVNDHLGLQTRFLWMRSMNLLRKWIFSYFSFILSFYLSLFYRPNRPLDNFWCRSNIFHDIYILCCYDLRSRSDDGIVLIKIDKRG